MDLLELEVGIDALLKANRNQGWDECFPCLGSGICRHVGRDGKGENEKDGEESPSGKLVVGNTPGGGDSQKEGEEAHASNHDGGFTESGAEQSRANVFP